MKPLHKLALLLPCLFFTQCALLHYHKHAPPLSEYRRPSNPAYFAAKNLTPKDSVAEMDADLSRRFWVPANSPETPETHYRYEVVVTPITVPLLDRIFREEALVENFPVTDTATAVNNLSRALVEDQSCFEVFLKAPALVKHDSRVGNYAVLYYNLGKKKRVARPLERNPKYASIFATARELFDTHLVTGVWSEDQRRIQGLGSYSRQILCGKKIDFNSPFSVQVRPRYDFTLKIATLTWLKPLLAE